MKSLALLCSLVFIALQLQAQLPTYNWARNPSPGTGGGLVSRVTTDNSLNSFVAGSFSSSLTFGSDVLTESNGACAYVAKYDLSGAVKWARCSSGGKSYGNAVATDPSGNVYLGGYFYTTIYFGSYTLTTSGLTDMFLVKFDPNGNVLWARQAGGTANEQITAIATDETGNVYFTGWSASATATFDVLTLSNSGTANAFLVKYSSAGGGIWATRVVGTNSQGREVIVDATGNVYFSGTFTLGSYTFGSDVITNSGNTDSFLAKYRASNGSEQWVSKIGASKEEFITGITLNSTGDIFITGDFSSSSVAVGTFTLTQSANYSSFVARYTPTGTVSWAIASTNSNTITSGSIVTGDCQGCINSNALCDNVYVSGTLNSASTFYFGGIGFTPQAGADNSWFAVFNASGTPLAGRVIPFGGVDQNTLGIDIDGNIYLAGDYNCSTGAVLGSDTLSCGGTTNPFTSQLVVSGCTATLPVTLTSFTAEIKNETCRINWMTASEINNDFFTVERSNDGKEFTALTRVDSKALNGNSSRSLNYDATDAKPLNGVSYYRLKQTDFDGKAVYSDIAVVTNSSAGFYPTIYPNPARNSFTVSLNSEIKTAELKMLDVAGRIVLEQQINSPLSTFNFQLSPGIYFVKVSDGNNAHVEKLTIQ